MLCHSLYTLTPYSYTTTVEATLRQVFKPNWSAETSTASSLPWQRAVVSVSVLWPDSKVNLTSHNFSLNNSYAISKFVIKMQCYSFVNRSGDYFLLVDKHHNLENM